MIELKQNNAQYAVIALSGSLNYSNQMKIKEELIRLIPTDQANVVLDFAKVEFIDSACLAAIISVMRALKEKSGVMKILSPLPEVRAIFQITRLDKVFTIIDNLDEAAKA